MNSTLWAAHLYGLSERQLVHVFENLPRGLGLWRQARRRTSPFPCMGAQVTRVDVRPEIFRWMRERAGMDLAGLTGRFPKYAEWEIGAVQPTFRQLEQLARTVHAPVGYFFFPEPVEEPVPIPDFRTIGSQPLARPSPNLLDTVYLCQQRQDWYREFVRREKEPPLSFVGSAKLGSDIEKVAAAIRKNLGFDLEERPRSSDMDRRTSAVRSNGGYARHSGDGVRHRRQQHAPQARPRRIPGIRPCGRPCAADLHQRRRLQGSADVHAGA